MTRTRPFPAAGLMIGVLIGVAALLVAASLRRPELPTYPPSVTEPVEVGDARVGPLTYTVDASAPEAWRFFDFSRGSRVERPGPLEWDIAFRRFGIIVNGGDGFAGAGGAIDLGRVGFDDVSELPLAGYHPTVVRRDSLNAAFEGWYNYGFTSHLLTPKPHVYALRTADGRHAKLEILSYYCPGAQPGCVTFRYVYDGSGSTSVAAPVNEAGAPGPDSDL